MSLNIIGISAFFHDAACCLLQDGVLVAAAEEERFTRIKADPAVPKNAFNYCLQQANLSMADIDCIAYYENPCKKMARQLWSGVLGNTPSVLSKLDPFMVENQFRNILGFEGEIKYFDHHASHAASSFFFSGFKQSAIFTIDGVGEWATTTYGTGDGSKIDLFEEVHFPDSIGLLYSAITSYLGFGVNDGEYKVMGLAPYGSPLYADKIRKLIIREENGQYRLDMQYFSFLKGKKMYADRFVELFGKNARQEGDAIKKFHEDVARSMQVVLEEILLDKATYLYNKTGMENLCMAGGVALNCVANGQILRKGPFKRMFVQPASNDAGGCMGAAALAHVVYTGERPTDKPLSHVYLGPDYSHKNIDQLLKATAIRYADHHSDTAKLITETAQRLADGKVIGWFHGRMEFGPRALGGRSILADPRNPQMRDLINAMVKKREGFRPFAPAVMEDKRTEHFDLDHTSPFMLETCQVISVLELPAITHVDGSARVQTVNRQTNPRFYDLLMEFNRLTGCPILLNTSFNIKGEPIVCSPEDALKCFITTDIDSLVLEDYIIDKKDNNFGFMQVVLPVIAIYDNNLESGITHDVYTFI
jgi:carbamoyltransferase